MEYKPDNLGSGALIMLPQSRSTLAPVFSSPEHPEPPCWRCHILEKKCDNDFPCAECLESGTEKECERHSLKDDFKDSLPLVPGLGTKEWILPALSDFSLKVKTQYQDRSLKIRCMDISLAWKRPDLKPQRPIVAFVRQFRNVNARRPDWTPHFSEQILNKCAQIQEDIVRGLERRAKPLREEDVFIASLLHLLALSHDISHIYYLIANGVSKEEFIKTKFLQAEQVTPAGVDPTIEISRCEPPGEYEGLDLCPMIQNAIDMLQRFLLNGHPKDWPTILVTLCILKLVEGHVYPHTQFIEGFGDCGKLNTIWTKLVNMFNLMVDDCNPLSISWNPDNYAKLVGEHSWELSIFSAFNNLWISLDYDLVDWDAGTDIRFAGNTYAEMLFNFVYGL